MLILSIRNIKPVDLSCGNSKLTDEKLSPTALSLNPTFSLESIFFCNLVASLCTKFSRVHGILPPYALLLFLVATVSFHNSQPQILTATPVQSGGLPVTYSGLSAWWRPRWTGFLLCTWPSTHQHPGVEREAGSLLKSQGLHAGALNGWRNLAREKSRGKQAMLKHSCLSLQSNSRSVRQPHISPGWIWDFTCSVSQLSEYAPTAYMCMTHACTRIFESLPPFAQWKNQAHFCHRQNLTRLNHSSFLGNYHWNCTMMMSNGLGVT